jgi:diguanylate cyclase (GGDEF)-like protein/PAS domain S-box-containing protein
LKRKLDAAYDQIIECEQRLLATLGAVHEGMVIRARDGSILSANLSAATILGFSIDQLFTGDPNGEWILINEQREEITSEQLPDKLALESGFQHPEVVIGIEKSDGTVLWLAMNAGPIFLKANEKAYASVLSFSDITDRKTSFDANARLAAIVDSSQDAIMCVTLDGMVVSWNRGAEKLFGYTADEAIGLPSPVLTPPHDRASFKEMVDKLVSGGTDDGCECIRFHKDGLPVHVSLTHSLVVNADKEPIAIAAIARDVTDRVRYEEQIQQQLDKINEINEELQAQQAELISANEQLATLATLDGLTSLKNHRYFQERIHEESLRSARYDIPLSLFILDVDNFKEYNDTYGHPAGDLVLKTVAKLLVSNCRTSDLVCRYGGEEFVVILPQTPAEGAYIIAERCRKVIEQNLWPLRRITASFGVSTYGETIHSAEDLIRAGDEAMYHSKRNGKNKVTHAQTLIVDEAPLKKAA